MSNTTLYFAYGSNLLKSRILMNNPTAVFKDIARLEHYRLDFIDESKTWKGAPATIIPINNSWVWGAVWEINNDQIENLDKQEEVHVGKYRVLYVDVTNPDGKVYVCRVYQTTKMVENPTELSKLPDDRLPSLIYLKVIVKGALDCGLPHEYVEFLRSIRHNGYMDEESPLGKEVSRIQLD
ncbi:gamma-glutamylcyclotransferase-like isoform X2 [Chelonus insularis]|nr:gamma-glutamylcyclotransferase-like isoform X2 [Chelonus insularis]XP_034939421.1 gamma-glutamylcyclotransferase-like isoform X2 [Chelonus insularis]